jgi:hypothetical protein
LRQASSDSSCESRKLATAVPGERRRLQRRAVGEFTAQGGEFFVDAGHAGASKWFHGAKI